MSAAAFEASRKWVVQRLDDRGRAGDDAGAKDYVLGVITGIVDSGDYTSLEKVARIRGAIVGLDQHRAQVLA